ncbi:MAG TPA: serine/threonine-protein kinase [Pyrinomonadaceae bacterium]|nr:serine/threonine-protein kinase [Pyrinomonadaceae bacterium]
MTLSLNSRVGRYEIRSLLGKGGMGEVYLAYDSSLRRQIALKLLPAEYTQDRVRLSRFEREAYAASSLNHPNILTIYEIGQQDGWHFIATEYIEGESLRQHMARSRLELREVLEVAQQVASALSAAHQAGIVHRDIKPENIMVRRDGYVKVLDFGLAKLADEATGMARQSVSDPEAPTKIGHTQPGMVMGTVSYMSPEQVRGLDVDARTDIWSLGVVLYEMLSGRLPFPGTTASDVMAAILQREPPSLSQYRSDVPGELERIVEKALTKEREERYQLAKDLGVDLKRLRQRLEVEAALERSITPEAKASRASARLTTGSQEPVTAEQTKGAPAQIAQTGAARSTSNAASLAGLIKRHRLAAALSLAVLLVAAVGAMFLYTHRAQALTEKDTILLADFVNTTGDPVFDGTLKQALAVQLDQSPFLNILSQERVREALRYMGRSPDERVTQDMAREICVRQGIKAFLVGTISSLGSDYVISLEAVNAQTGDAIAREQAEAQGKEQVLRSLGVAASKLREKLGESLSSIQKFDAPIEQATTSSLEALKAFALGDEQRAKGHELDAILFYKRAVELDPNFALAYARLAVAYSNAGQPELADEYAQKAFELRDRVSERERLYLSQHYYNFVTGEVEKWIEVLELYHQTYPRDNAPPNNLAVACNLTGRYDKAVEEAREAIRLNPNFPNGYLLEGGAFLGLNRFDEAGTIWKQAAQKFDSATLHFEFYLLAFLRGDAAAMRQQVDWAGGKPDEFVMVYLQSRTAGFYGQWRRARELSGRAVDLAQQRELKEAAAGYLSTDALIDAALGNYQQAKDETTKALNIARNRVSLSRSALALALCGERGQAQPLVDELARRFPKDSFINVTWLPAIRAAIEIHDNNPAQAILLLQTADRYELGAEASLWPAYVRGLAYLRQHAGPEAVAEFRKILDHKGVLVAGNPFTPDTLALYPLAQLGVARAAALNGDAATSRKAYQDFLALWKDADSDTPVLQEAKREYAAAE